MGRFLSFDGRKNAKLIGVVQDRPSRGLEILYLERFARTLRPHLAWLHFTSEAVVFVSVPRIALSVEL